MMASAPLLKKNSQALLLTSYLSTMEAKRVKKETVDFYEKIFCMSAHTASLLLGS